METPPAPNGATKKSTLNSLSKTSLNLTPCRRLGLGRPSTGSLKKSLHLRVVNSPPNNQTDCIPSKLDSVSTAIEESAVENCRPTEKFKALVDSTGSDLLNTPTIGTTRVRRCLKISLKTPPNYIPVTFKRVSDSESTTKPVASEESQCNAIHMGRSKRRRVSLKNSSVNISDNDCVSEETERDCYSPEACSVGKEIQSPSDVTPEMITQLIATIQEKKKKLEQLKVQDVYAKKHNLTELREHTDKWKTAGREALRYSMDLARRAGYSMTLSQLMAQHGFPPQLMRYNSEDDEFD